MGLYILTSMFHNVFPEDTAELLRQRIARRKRFAFVASEFEKLHEKTDDYLNYF